MAVLTLDKIIFRNNDSYLKMYKGSELIAEVESTPALDYLTFTALEAGSTVFVNNVGRTGVTSEYSTDGGSTWTSGDGITVTLSNVGDKVMYRGVTTEQTSSATTSLFGLTGQIKASGSINSMINKNPDDTSLSGKDYAFVSYFYNQTALKDISELKLPATTVTNGCYRYMFYGCTGLTTIPNNFLPATTLTGACYYSMFRGCTGLITLPANLLPATTLTGGCYRNMFYGCTGLITLPANLLPATTLTGATFCYDSMFYGCTGLTTVPTLPATTLANSCYRYMFRDCTELTTLPANLLPATTLTNANNCYDSMFYNCTGITAAPALPATTLANSCYRYMFYGCTGLTTIPTLPATTLADACYYYMFYGCTGLTTIPANLLPATTLTSQCYSNMFQNCTGITTAPTLPATTLVQYCYLSMFNGCTNLNKVVTYAQDISALQCIYLWLSNVASTGDFYNLGNANYGSSVSGIPTGWTEHIPLQPLTFTALKGNSTVKFNRTGVTSEYSTDGGTTWTNGDNVTVSLNNGDKVMYRGVTSTLSTDPSTAFILRGGIKASGSVMSMINKNPEDTSLSGLNYAFAHYFDYQSALEDISELVLPATTLANYCYRMMFYNCSKITTVPANLLPATTLAQYCYDMMFYNCTGLTTVPELPATTLAQNCYSNMFQNCNSLTSTPDLPATTLVKNCYSNMFSGCNSLNRVVTYARSISASGCLRTWLNSVSSTGDFYNLGGASYSSGASGIPSGWTRHTTL